MFCAQRVPITAIPLTLHTSMPLKRKPLPEFDLDVLKNDNKYGCYNKDAINAGVSCARLLQINDWKVPSDYPYRF